MKKINTFFYHIGQGFQGIYRNSVMSIASLLVLVSCMMIIGTFYLLITNIDRAFKEIDGINVMAIFLNDSLQDEEVDEIMVQLKDIQRKQGSIEKFEYFTSEEHFIKFMENEPEDSSIRRFFSEESNPLPRFISIEFISLSDPNFDIDKVYSLKSSIEAIEGIDNENIKENISLYDKFSGIKSTLTIAGVWIMAILIIVSLFVIMNTIKLGVYARREEIIFMRYVGATKSFIRTPFTIEGILIGLISAGAAYGLQYYVYEYILRNIASSSSDILSGNIFASFDNYSRFILLLFLAVGVVIGVFGSRMSIKKYLKA